MADPPSYPELLTTLEAAELLLTSARTLEGYRSAGIGPPFAKLGPGKAAKVLYRRQALYDWLAQFDQNPKPPKPPPKPDKPK